LWFEASPGKKLVKPHLNQQAEVTHTVNPITPEAWIGRSPSKAGPRGKKMGDTTYKITKAKMVWRCESSGKTSV
jgi:hypothetical protein